MSTTVDPRLAGLEVMRARLCDEAAPGEVSHQAVGADSAAEVLRRQQADGSWADVRYACENLRDWDAAKHLRRLRQLARAWYVNAAGERDDPAWLAGILRGLDFWYGRDPRSANWWWNQIGAPLTLGYALLYLKGACDRSYLARAVPALTSHEPAVRFTGQNLVWVATAGVLHGILLDIPERVSQAYMLIGKEVNVLFGEEGIQPDMSFYQHGRVLYSGGYGQGFAQDVARIVWMAEGTPFAWPAHKVDLLLRFLLDGSRWMVRGRTFEYGAIGREITRPGHSAERFFEGVRRLAAVDHPRREEVRAIAECADPRGRSFVTGNRVFWCSDLMTAHRPGYYLSVRVASSRIENADWPCCGGEGRLAHHLADGATFLMRDGDEYRDLFPAWNWRQIPGATVVQEPGELAIDRVRGFAACDFAGGASDGLVGCMAMDLRRDGLAARKAWFHFDDCLVALGAGITCESTHPVRTTLNQCHWRGPATAHGGAVLPAGEHPLAAGACVRHDGLGYRVLDGRGALRLGEQSGAWSECGVGSSDPVALPVFNAGLDHGVRPRGATCAYAVEFGAGPAPVEVVANTPAVQAVWHAGARRGHAVFYQPGEAAFPDGQRLAVSLPCVVLYHPQPGGGVRLTVAQPAHRGGEVTFRLAGAVTATVGVSLPVREYAGSSVTVTAGRVQGPEQGQAGETP